MKNCFIVSVLLAGLAEARPIEVFVSPTGDDGAVGTAAAPLRSPQGARDFLRAHRAADASFAGARVVFADGVYRLTEPVVLEAPDGGTAAAPVVWCAAHPGQAVFSGLVTPNWHKPTADDALLAKLPAGAREHVRVAALPGEGPVPGFHGGGQSPARRQPEVSYHLYREGRRLPLARWPNAEWAKTGEIITNGCFRFDSPRLAAWVQEPDLWAKGLWKFEWDDRREEVLKVDPAAGILEVCAAGNPYGFAKNRNFFVFNALCELDQAGEWALDRAGRRVIAWLDDAPAELAVATNLVSATKLAHLTFDGLAFAGARAEALCLRDCSHIRVYAADVRLTGGWGIQVKGGEDVRVEGCDLHDLGEGGVLLEGGDRATLRPARHVADNCHIHHYGEVSHNYKPGVSLYGVGNAATHNLIHHSDHQGLFFNGNDHYLAFNVVHDTCRFNDDAGAIYCCTRDWTELGTVIEHNLVHWTGKNPRPTNTHAVYLDDWSSGVTVRGNILTRASLGVYVGGGQHCTVTGNLIVGMNAPVRLNSRGAKSFAKATALAGAKSGIYRKLKKLSEGPAGALWRTRYPGCFDLLGLGDAVFAHNALYNVVTGNVYAASGRFGCDPDVDDPRWNTFENVCDVSGDPGFVDYCGLDFALKPDSPAFKTLGRMRYAEMGLYASAHRLTPPVKFGAAATRPAAPPRRLLNPAHARIDIAFPKLPADAREVAENLRDCEIPDWARGQRLVADFGAVTEKWRTCSFSFTPKMDAPVSLLVMGVYGDKTLYDDFRVTGAEFGDPGCETNAPPWHEQRCVERPPLGDIDPPYGILRGADYAFTPAEGQSAIAANHERQMRHTIHVKKGVPVTISFQARALPEAARSTPRRRDRTPRAPHIVHELFNGRDLSGWRPSLKGRDFGEDPRRVFRIVDGALVVTGEENGALFTEEAWKDYKLTVEYRWLGTGPGAEKGRCGDSGVLLHARGDEKAFAGAWPVAYECNLILGKTGDLCLLGPKAASNDLKCLSWLDERGRWNHWKGNWRRLGAGGRINAATDRKDWKGLKGQLANPPERPEGEWNRLEVTARGNTLVLALNGVVINSAIDLQPAGGRLALQSVGHGVAFRRVTLEPLGDVKPVNVPPLLTAADGSSVKTAAQWEQVRRPELVETFTSHMYGRRDVERPPTLAFETAEPDKVMMDGKALRRRVRIAWSGPYGEQSFVATAFIPTVATPARKAPAFVLICNRQPGPNIDPERVAKSPFWPAEEIVAHGYAAVAFFNGDVAWDKYNGENAFTNGVYACFRRAADRTGESWGALTAWGWGASRVLDWLETEPLVDARHVAVVGHSRGGKAALCAGAFDTRFAMTCSNDSGCGGAKLNHIDLTASEHIHQITTAVPYWFCRDFREKCAGRDAELNFDQHQFLALVAPRLLYVASAAEDSWAGPEGEYWAARLAAPAWALYGKKGLVSTGYPAVGQSLQEGNVAYHRREGSHNLTLEDWNRFMDFADRHGWRSAPAEVPLRR